MRNIQKNKKSWFKGLVVAGVFAVSVLNLSIDLRRDADGGIDLVTLSSTVAKATPEGSTNGHKCRCHLGTYDCRDGSWFSFRAPCSCMHLNGHICYPN